MCFGGGGGGPSQAEKQVSVDQSLEADAAQRESAEDLASQKRNQLHRQAHCQSLRVGPSAPHCQT